MPAVRKLTFRLLSILALVGTLSGCIVVEHDRSAYYPRPYWHHYDRW